MVRMRVCTDTSSRCDECMAEWGRTREMYDLELFGERRHVCKRCAETLFRKLLKASCAYDGKVKTKEDKERARKEDARIGGQ